VQFVFENNKRLMMKIEIERGENRRWWYTKEINQIKK